MSALRRRAASVTITEDTGLQNPQLNDIIYSFMNTSIKFSKMSGAGNDFIVFDNMHKDIHLSADNIRSLCTRRTGIGADGLILIEPSDRFDFAMKYYNADGLPGSMCGNGGRCAVYFAWTIGACGTTTAFEANGNRYDAWVCDNEAIRLKMILPHDFRDVFNSNGFSCNFVNTGSPHTIIFTDELDTFDVESTGRLIRNDSTLFPEGTNVNFLQVTSPQSLKVRTYERGVEAETLACGTGAVAAALMSYRLGKIGSRSVSVSVRSGDILTIDFSEDMQDVYLSGPATIVYTGSIHM